MQGIGNHQRSFNHVSFTAKNNVPNGVKALVTVAAVGMHPVDSNLHLLSHHVVDEGVSMHHVPEEENGYHLHEKMMKAIKKKDPHTVDHFFNEHGLRAPKLPAKPKEANPVQMVKRAVQVISELFDKAIKTNMGKRI
ncbi:MAG: hypothetical protein WCK67_13595 [bacterium]